MLARSIAILTLACALTGCAMRGKDVVPGGAPPAAQARALPGVVQKGKGAQWVQFAPHTLGALYSAIVLGPDKNLWFIDENAAALVRIGESGASKEFSLSGILSGSGVSMAVGTDKKFYVLDESSNVVRVTDKGVAQSFPIPSGDNTAIDGLGLGPDGNIWFAEFSHIGKITPGGKITEFAYPSGYTTNQYGGVTAGSDGKVWFAESSANAIGKVDPSTGKITMFPISVSCTPAPVVLANDKNVWFFCLTSSPLLGRITPSGKISTFAVGGTFNSNETEQFCERGPDGEPWCASGNGGNIFRLDSKTQKVMTFTPPLPSGARPDALAAGADGNVWVDSVGGVVDVFVVNPMTVKPNKLNFPSTGQTQTVTVSEHGVSSWSAKSSKPSVATVAQGSSNSVFKVTSVGKGSCKITIADSGGNSVAEKVTVH
jgi:virginiamycin B lyase